MARTSLIDAARTVTGDDSLDAIATLALDRRPRRAVGAVLVVALVVGLVVGSNVLRVGAGVGILVMLLSGRELVVAVGPNAAFGFVRWILAFRLGPSYYGVLPSHVAPAGRSDWVVGQYRVRPSEAACAVLERVRSLPARTAAATETDAPVESPDRNGNSSRDHGS